MIANQNTSENNWGCCNVLGHHKEREMMRSKKGSSSQPQESRTRSWAEVSVVAINPKPGHSYPVSCTTAAGERDQREMLRCIQVKNKLKELRLRSWAENIVHPLSPNVQIQLILHTDLHTFPWKIGWENLLKDQSISFWWLFHKLSQPFSLDYVLTLSGEYWCCSLFGLKQLCNRPNTCLPLSKKRLMMTMTF